MRKNINKTLLKVKTLMIIYFKNQVLIIIIINKYKDKKKMKKEKLMKMSNYLKIHFYKQTIINYNKN